MKPAKIAPKSSDASPDDASSPALSAAAKSFACLNCATRKTKCDKEHPSCTACRQRQLTCRYENAAVPGSRKRKATEDANGRLERFERILAQHGLVTDEVKQLESSPIAAEDSSHVDELHRDPAKTAPSTGMLIVEENNSRYINSNLWHEVSNQGLGGIVEEDVFGAAADAAGSTTALPPVSLSRGLLGTTGSLLEYHPSVADAARLWKIYARNVEPLYKFLHTPTARSLVTTASQALSQATPADHCLLFAIYLLAIFSMDDDACLAEFGQTRSLLLSQYDYGVRQALFNASWLSASHMSTLLAFVMYLHVMRRKADPRSLWIWTGMGVRIMQRMGIHRDGEAMRLRRYDVELRRRLYWNLVSLDTYAGRISGSSDAGPPKTWDTKLPSNLNDDQISPEATESPRVRPGATDMIFSLVHIKLGNLFAAESPGPRGCDPANPTWDATERKIDSLENEIESQYLRYCDPVEPVHALTLMTARAAIGAARLRQRMPLVAHQVPGRDAERREFYALARRIMDAESYTYTNPVIRPFRWFVRASFRWDALICLLMGLARPHFFTTEECAGGWERVGEFFRNRAEVIETGGTLQRTVGRMTLMAWLANPPESYGREPDYITTLRALHPETVAVAPDRPVNGEVGEVEPDFFSSIDGTASFDISMFLNNSILGSDSGWGGLFDSVFD